jgi:hypothetical protein
MLTHLYRALLHPGKKKATLSCSVHSLLYFLCLESLASRSLYLSHHLSIFLFFSSLSSRPLIILILHLSHSSLSPLSCICKCSGLPGASAPSTTGRRGGGLPGLPGVGALDTRPQGPVARGRGAAASARRHGGGRTRPWPGGTGGSS